MIKERISLKVVTIDKDRIKKNTQTAFALFRLNPDYPINPACEDYLPVTKEGHLWTAEDLGKIQTIGTLFVLETAKKLWEEYLEEQTFRLGGDPPALVIQKLEDISAHLLEMSRSSKLDAELMSDFRHVATGVVDLLKELKEVIRHIRTLVDHSSYTYYHSAGVAMFAPAIAMELGENSDMVLREYALGGLLHDLGKLDISTKIIDKAGALDEKEWELIRTHPLKGLERIEAVPGITQRIKNMVALHHEKLNGKGYPYGLAAYKIPDEARIMAMADIFSALTTTRSYRHKRTHFEALMLIKHNMLSEVWAPALEALVRILGNN